MLWSPESALDLNCDGQSAHPLVFFFKANVYDIWSEFHQLFSVVHAGKLYFDDYNLAELWTV